GCLEIQGASLDTSSKKAIKKHFKQLLEKLPPLLRQKKRIYMKSHLLTEARTQKLICSLRRKGLDVTAERRESAMNSVMFRILIVSRILSQWKVPHINPRCGIVILTLKNDSGNRE
ncbi:conjugal transfer protein TraD, partial [Escherichia coli]|nr:conjugal transfer protein TraD [Escherichia coli]